MDVTQASLMLQGSIGVMQGSITHIGSTASPQTAGNTEMAAFFLYLCVWPLIVVLLMALMGQEKYEPRPIRLEARILGSKTDQQVLLKWKQRTEFLEEKKVLLVRREKIEFPPGVAKPYGEKYTKPMVIAITKTYTYTDCTVQPGKTYQYWIEKRYLERVGQGEYIEKSTDPSNIVTIHT